MNNDDHEPRPCWVSNPKGDWQSESHISDCDHRQTSTALIPDSFTTNGDVIKHKIFVRVITGLKL